MQILQNFKHNPKINTIFISKVNQSVNYRFCVYHIDCTHSATMGPFVVNRGNLVSELDLCVRKKEMHTETVILW